MFSFLYSDEEYILLYLSEAERVIYKSHSTKISSKELILELKDMF